MINGEYFKLALECETTEDSLIFINEQARKLIESGQSKNMSSARETVISGLIYFAGYYDKVTEKKIGELFGAWRDNK